MLPKPLLVVNASLPRYTLKMCCVAPGLTLKLRLRGSLPRQPSGAPALKQSWLQTGSRLKTTFAGPGSTPKSPPPALPTRSACATRSEESACRKPSTWRCAVIDHSHHQISSIDGALLVDHSERFENSVAHALEFVVLEMGLQCAYSLFAVVDLREHCSQAGISQHVLQFGVVA